MGAIWNKLWCFMATTDVHAVMESMKIGCELRRVVVRAERRLQMNENKDARMCSHMQVLD